MTKIEIENIELVFNFKAAGVTEKRKLSDLPTKTVLTLLQYGTRKANDSVNSSFNDEKNDKTREELIADFMAKIDSGEFNPSRDTSESDFKAFVKKWLVIKGAPKKSLNGKSLDDMLTGIATKNKLDVAEVEKQLRNAWEAEKAVSEGLALK